MDKRIKGFAVMAMAFLMTGCATNNTGKNYQADIDSLNAKTSALQGQLSSKDQEISLLQKQINDEKAARAKAEADARAAEDEKRALAEKAARAAAAAKAPESDLK